MILVTGGLGYIGSVLVNELKKLNLEVCFIDNQSRSRRRPPEGIPHAIIDIRDTNEVSKFMKKHKVTSVIHLAGYMINDESIKKPDLYYSINTEGTLSVLKAMVSNSVTTIVFASTSSIYESDNELLAEESIIKPDTPYAQSKWAAEEMIRFYVENFGISAGLPRFFNVSGANDAFGEQHWPETCLIPLLVEACMNKSENTFSIYGDSHPTRDGYCVRDYIHILDLVDGLLKIHEYTTHNIGHHVFNLGSGMGNSVKEVVDLAQAITGSNLNYTILDNPRPGDPASLVANISKAEKYLKFQPKYGLRDILTSQYQWMNKERLLTHFYERR
jgi:UDP-glucose 4-epimerase